MVLVAHSGTCVLVEDRTVDTANNTALARKAEELGLSKQTTLIVRGLDDHVNFINHPDPIVIQVLEVIPPEPPKLLRMVEHVLTYADLPAIKLEVQEIDIRNLADNIQNTKALLVPCRSSGLDFEIPTYFLDEHPNRHNWLMLGCERSLQIHEHFYGDRPLCIDICPRNFKHDNGALQLIKCCLLEKDIEMDEHGLMYIDGQPVILFIKDTWNTVDMLSHDPKGPNRIRFHVTGDCTTMEQMKKKIY